MGSSILVELEFENVGFCGGTKIREPEKKPLGASRATTNNQQVHKEISISKNIEKKKHCKRNGKLVKDPNLLEAVHYAQDVKDFERFDGISNTKIDLPSTFKRIELVLRTNEKLK